MKVYKNPFVSRKSYFVKTGKARTGRCEASASKGYIIEQKDGKWNVRTGTYYDMSLRKDMPLIAENRVPIMGIIEKAVLNAVLDLIGDADANGGADDAAD